MAGEGRSRRSGRIFEIENEGESEDDDDNDEEEGWPGWTVRWSSRLAKLGATATAATTVASRSRSQ